MRWLAVAVAAILLVLPAGCSDDPAAEEDYPAGSVRLRQNIPTPVGEHTLVAVNINGDEGIVVVEPPQGDAVNVPVVEGERAQAEGLAFDVVDVVEGDEESQQPGAPGGLIVVLPE